MYELETRLRLGQLIRASSSISKIYQKKAVLYGKVIEVFDYKKLQITETRKGKFFNRDPFAKRTESSISRARLRLLRLVESNSHDEDFLTVFLTLTYAEHITDLQKSNIEFKNFLKRLNYYVGVKLKYVAVPEWTKIGRIHYHILFFNLPFIPKEIIEKKWGHGFTRIEVVKGIENNGLYLAKYFAKSARERSTTNKKAYFCSRGLLRPIDIYGGHEVDTVLSRAIIETEYHRDYKTHKHIKSICQHLVT